MPNETTTNEDLFTTEDEDIIEPHYDEEGEFINISWVIFKIPRR